MRVTSCKELDHISANGHEVQRAATDHEQVPDAVPVAKACVVDEEHDARRIHHAAGQQPGEAFAAQVLCTLKAWEDAEYCRTRLGLDAPLGAIDRSKLNVKGSSLAAGHPFAATGGRIVANLAKLLHQAGPGKRGLISICAAGGQGVVAILES